MKRSMIAILFSSALLLSACSGPTPGEQLDTVLKDTFEAEKDYRDTQGEMEKLEKNEQQLFESIMALTQEQQDEVKAQAEEAMASADDRLALLEQEKESMGTAEETFNEIDTVIEEAKENEVKADLTALKEKMQERFNAHADFAAAYENLTSLQKELYEMLLNEETDLQMLQEKTAEVNEQNTKVQEAVTVFNEQTEQFNELKDSTIDNLTEE
ncbi:putative cell-wall binding lipoprotein [Planomicrobium soli]|uniref:Putative cell-wall binding lipoprotein n=1 Tax=Planomicrobium soli TaxID=1176648 RepID=A0A2P8G176_9BACL|nr:YkyA family protein [Planomicrobium soli]PSL27716.1 putative cell-wall binding lipoprotein [Planomicrobium soli]